MKSSNTMRGTILANFVKYCNKNASTTTKNIVDLEKTRNRKKPPGGTRYLIDEKLMYLFNAW